MPATLRSDASGILAAIRLNGVDRLLLDDDGALRASVNPATGLRSVALATMQKFADEFDVLLSANGWQKLPSGLIIQWGTAVGGASAAAAITFPMAFPTAFRAIAFGPVYGSGALLVAQVESTPTVSGFTFGTFLAGGRSAQSSFYIAVGY